MKHIGLFEGIGGFSLAAKWMGWQTKAWCEWNPFGQQVLKHYFPEADGFGDITKTDFTKYANSIDILTGGFPCQPYSQAGKRLGKEDERHLFPEMLRAIREISPCYVVGENVSGLTNWNGGMVFNEVQADLEAEGYEVLPFLLPACAVNAPHRRDRIWFIAYSESKRSSRLRSGKKETYAINGSNGRDGIITNTTGLRKRPGTKEQGKDVGSWEQLERTKQGSNSNDISKSRIITNSYATGQRRNEWQSESKSNIWEQFPTQSPLCSGDDGLPRELDGITFSKWRNESLKAFGNAIVPQVALQIFRVIAEMEASYTGGGVGANTNTQDKAKLETSSGIA